jgi:RHS repeat-associated protein
VALLRPAGRGATRYAYDLDGRALRKLAEAEPESGGASVGWEEVTLYDATGRVVEVQHEDGTSERLTYYPDNLVATRTTREGVLVSYQYDAANRLLSATPSAAGGADGEPVTLPSSLAPLDAGDAYAWDALSRRTASRRGRDGVSGYDASLEVEWPSFDLASRPREERVGARGALAWSWDTWNRPVGLELPSVARVGAFGAPDPLRGWTRQYDTLDRLVDLAGVGAAAAGTPGATWAWGGRDRLYAMTTRASLGTGLRLGYLAGAGAQPPGVGGGDGDGASRWRLGTLVWGGAAEGGAGAGSGADSGATAPPAAPWGSFGYAWRGSESSEGDALKIGRAVLGASDAFAGLGWTIGYDGAERVATAVPGAGSLAGGGAEGGGGSGAGGAGSGSSPEGMGADAYSYEYGVGDELTRRIDQRTGELESVVSGADGRLLALDGETFGYDPAGRRTEDARFQYQWSWRGELVRLDVKEGAEEAWGSPYEGHMVRYAYDALGRLTNRTHWGPLPEGESDDTLRPFIERRDYVWDQQSRVAEIGSSDPEGAQVRWRKLYVPGPGGLDDAVQVVVQNVDGSEALYSILRDEIGSVIALVAEDETREGAGGTVDPTRPAIPVRYRYSPFGAALAETSPRVERLLFDNELVEVGGFQQADVPERDDAVAAAGALRVWFSAALDIATLGAGVVLESRTAGGAWTEVPAATPGGSEGLVLALDPESGTELRVLLVEGWRRGVAYRVRLRAELRDVLGRAPPASGPGGSASGAALLQWTVPDGEGQTIAYEQRFASGERFESWAASGDTVGGRFPGGQNGLFHGLWTDPVSGISYARARWYGARTGAFLSEDPLRDVDSPNLYQYALWSSFNYSDPLGLCTDEEWNLKCLWWTATGFAAETAKDAGSAALNAAVTSADLMTAGTVSDVRARVQTFFGTEGTFSERVDAANRAGLEARADALSLGFFSAEDKGEHAMQLSGLGGVRDGGRRMGEAIAEGESDEFWLGFSEALEGGSQFALTVSGGYRIAKGPAPAASSAPATEQLLLPPPPTVRHHIFNKFRGNSQKSQKYRDFFKRHGIKVDDFTVEIPEPMHREFIHRGGANWTTRWKRWIDENPDASTTRVYQFAGELMDEYGLSDLSIVPYRGPQ